jgi:predicted sulfurtransferase
MVHLAKKISTRRAGMKEVYTLRGGILSFADE